MRPIFLACVLALAGCASLCGCVYPHPGSYAVPSPCAPPQCSSQAYGPPARTPALNAYFDDGGASRLYRTYPGRINVQQTVPQ